MIIYVHGIIGHEIINYFYPFDIWANVVVEVGNP